MNKQTGLLSKEPPAIALRFKEIDGKHYIQSAPFRPGMMIKRCGKTYQVDANGTQRRVKQ